MLPIDPQSFLRRSVLELFGYHTDIQRILRALVCRAKATWLRQ
jgi:hypothetical protein